MESERNINIRMITSDEIPETVDGACMKLDGPDDYMMMINGAKNERKQLLAYLHECLHIWHKDHDGKGLVQDIERARDEELKELLDELTSNI